MEFHVFIQSSKSFHSYPEPCNGGRCSPWQGDETPFSLVVLYGCKMEILTLTEEHKLEESYKLKSNGQLLVLLKISQVENSEITYQGTFTILSLMLLQPMIG
jgi:hypothetical protein